MRRFFFKQKDVSFTVYMVLVFGRVKIDPNEIMKKA
jgi:hypothetical protein